MQIGSRLIKNTGLVFVSGITTKLFSFFFIAYAARVLGPGDFGLYALIGTITFLFSYFGNLGITPMAIREISKNKHKAHELFNHIISLRLALVMVSYPLLVLAVNLLGYREDVKGLIYIAGLSAILGTFSHSLGILYIAFERFKIPSLVSIVVSFLGNATNILVLYLGYGLKGIIWVALLESLLGAVVSGLWVRMRFLKYRLAFHSLVWNDLMSQALPFAILSFFQQAIMQINTILLSKLPGLFPGEIAIGYYNPAASLCKAALMLPDSLRQAALPTIASNAENLEMVKGIIDKSTHVLLIMIIFPLILITTFFPKEIITIVFGKEYLPSAPALTIMGWAYAFQVFNTPVNVALAATREIKKFIPWVILLFGINILFAVPLILYYSFTGAAIAFLVTKVIETIFRNYLLRTIWGIKRLEIGKLVKIIFPMTIIFVVLLFAYLGSLSSFRLFILTLVLYVVFLCFMKDIRQRFVAFIDKFRRRSYL
ncbi:MAG: hypothetical protein CV087_00065 [Candidatus Brocadia sp. WS118]|nr:MAG: hypothetical protein CV087_00065 [Candidatus Brocadia sp. WS118]